MTDRVLNYYCLQAHQLQAQHNTNPEQGILYNTNTENDLIQINQNIDEQVKKITTDATHTITEQRRAVLEDKSIYFNFETTESSFLKKEDDMISTTSNTHWHKMNMDEISNATIEDTKIIQLSSNKQNSNTCKHGIDIKEPEGINMGKRKPQLPKDKDTLLENIKTTKDALQIPITKYRWGYLLTQKTIPKQYTMNNHNPIKQNNTTLMINSILKRHTDHGDLPNIKKEDAVITDPAEIKTKVANHFKRWIERKEPNRTFWPEWEVEYHLKNYIQDT
ncbi:36406_t:CDS:2 [Gigaspora margarita]|uniref:36406_t:CDS:1 n=1 Tax=Gigaspora margarita TaxID=4874 RepID=A0ABN7UWG3_GIGMA|nr:36406_t:CDS:2 [Gigaspora margarita]